MTGARLPERWYPWIFVAFMAVVVAANGALVFFAVVSATGLETEHHYQKGIDYNDDLAGARAQAALGWRIDFSFASQSGNRLEVAFRDAEGRSIEDLEVRALLIRPTHGGFDAGVRLEHRGGGVYGTSLRPPLSGQWEVRIHAYRDDESFQLSRRILVP